MITLEFILIDSVNDTLDQAMPLQNRHGSHAYINLIPYNAVPHGMETTVHQSTRPIPHRLKSKQRDHSQGEGHDIAAACGQLKLQTESVV